MGEFQPTEEQQAIVAAVRASPADSLMVNAYAGCAKTTTLALMSPEVKVPALALAFNKRIAEELKPKLGGNFTVKTINGLGFQAWRQANPGIAKWDLDDRKLGKIIKEVLKDRKVELSQDQWGALRSLVQAAMNVGLVPQSKGSPIMEDTLENWLVIGDQAWIDRDTVGFLVDLAREVLERDIELAKQGIISFDDQVYCPTVLGGKWPQFPVMFVDESQDLSPLNHRMLSLASRKDGRLVAVGDPKQAIYAFRGASSDSMDRIRGLRGRWQTLPLATTFRCPKGIVERQQTHAPGFKAFHTNKPGVIQSFGPATGWDWAGVEALREQAGAASVAIICRNNAPLLSMAFKLIRQGVGCQILGREIGKGLIALSRKIVPDDSTPAVKVAAAIKDWQEHEASLALANDNAAKVSSINDRADCLQAVLEGALARDAGQLRLMLENLFDRQGGLVTLSTGHKFKGLEADFVIHLDPWRIPSRAAMVERGFSQVEIEQECNLRYVIETRSRNVLVNASLEDFGRRAQV
jgi:DNA helicase-2/ATP-dependent DNA helicase PcrA